MKLLVQVTNNSIKPTTILTEIFPCFHK